MCSRLNIIQPVGVSSILFITEKKAFPLLDEEKAQQQSKEIEGTHVVKNEFDATAILIGKA